MTPAGAEARALKRATELYDRDRWAGARQAMAYGASAFSVLSMAALLVAGHGGYGPVAAFFGALSLLGAFAFVTGARRDARHWAAARTVDAAVARALATLAEPEVDPVDEKELAVLVDDLHAAHAAMAAADAPQPVTYDQPAWPGVAA